MARRDRIGIACAALLCVVAIGGCRQDMHDQPRYESYRSSAFFNDGRAARPLVPGTVPRGHLNDDALVFTGKIGEEFAARFPLAVDHHLLRRGRERYEIYCAPCHDRTGSGQGMIVRRGYRKPASLHEERLRNAPVGYYFDVISRGFGVMPDYAAQIPVRDRWAIIAYIRALQLSQNARLEDVPPAHREKLRVP